MIKFLLIIVLLCLIAAFISVNLAKAAMYGFGIYLAIEHLGLPPR